MSGSHLYAPWRMEYIARLAKSGGCFICEAVAAKSDEERKQRLVIWSSEQSIILINRYPYTNGHLLIAPKAHKAELAELSQAEQLDHAGWHGQVLLPVSVAMGHGQLSTVAHATPNSSELVILGVYGRLDAEKTGARRGGRGDAADSASGSGVD